MSRVDAVLIMIASAAAAMATTALTVSWIIRAFTGPVTLTLPLHTAHQRLTGLGLDSVGRYTTMEATIPALSADVAMLVTGAFALALAGSVAQILDSAARPRIAELIGANQRTPGETILFVGEFNAAPLLAGIILVLVAGVFQFGRRLQKDTEGLI